MVQVWPGLPLVLPLPTLGMLSSPSAAICHPPATGTNEPDKLNSKPLLVFKVGKLILAVPNLRPLLSTMDGNESGALRPPHSLGMASAGLAMRRLGRLR